MLSFHLPFEEASILTMDGVGEWSTSSIAIGKRKNIEIKKEINFPHSLGLLYYAFTYYTGLGSFWRIQSYGSCTLW